MFQKKEKIKKFLEINQRNFFFCNFLFIGKKFFTISSEKIYKTPKRKINKKKVLKIVELLFETSRKFLFFSNKKASHYSFSNETEIFSKKKFSFSFFPVI